MMITLSSVKLTLLISMIHARISLEKMKTALNEVFGDCNRQHSIVNPIFGFFFLTNGSAENMRLYSPELLTGYVTRKIFCPG